MQLILDFPIKPHYGFANFVVCSGNETAFRFSQRLVSADAEENLLYLHGPAGSGKTHLLEACAAAIGAQLDTASSSPVFSFKETPGMASGAIAALLQRRFQEAPALLIDDIHLAPSDQTMKGAVWQLFNDFHGMSKPIITTGINPPKELANLDDHLASRLLWGLVARVDVSDDESRQMIMKKLAADRQVIIPDDVCESLLRQLPRDIPTLIETLDRIIRHALATARKVTPRLAAEVLSGRGCQ
ncbi:chromosomal replication initiator protein DnaA [Geobacter sp. OR-1]|uniref:DnaA/Hda family protein n=1 Tax=Geobacter sp. OR-1 TaxID=1266765 RepID=UPI0005432B4D|nr:DnaA/Hda family protein [Geobacter sp. OR-1]GAM11795.1 chromosomal replication initiator protein DnaA [Geobacter sp. OR-1]